MIKENRASKYFLYAIGEIILVVIGILIALSINNWNEKGKAQTLEKDLLKEVQSSLLKDLNDVKSNIEVHQKIIASQQIMINWIESNEEFNDTLSSHFTRTYTGTYFAAYQGPYETLKQIGMRNITNDSLRNQISKLYNIDYPKYTQFEDLVAKSMNEKLMTNSFEHFNEITWTKPMTINDISKMRSDNKFKSILKTTRNLAEVLIYVGMIPTKKRNRNYIGND